MNNAERDMYTNEKWKRHDLVNQINFCVHHSFKVTECKQQLKNVEECRERNYVWKMIKTKNWPYDINVVVAIIIMITTTRKGGGGWKIDKTQKNNKFNKQMLQTDTKRIQEKEWLGRKRDPAWIMQVIKIRPFWENEYANYIHKLEILDKNWSPNLGQKTKSQPLWSYNSNKINLNNSRGVGQIFSKIELFHF